MLNGGIGTVEAAREQLSRLDGVMMGRAAYQEPWRLLAVDPLVFGAAAPYASAKEAGGGADALHRARAFARRAPAFNHTPSAWSVPRGARRARVSTPSRDAAVKPGACAAVLAEALALVVDSPSELAHTAAA